MKKIIEKKTPWQNMRWVYSASLLLFVGCNVHSYMFNKHVYSIIVLGFSGFITLVSLLFAWITKLLTQQNRATDLDENKLKYWTTYAFALLLLVVPSLFYLITTIQHNTSLFLTCN